MKGSAELQSRKLMTNAAKLPVTTGREDVSVMFVTLSSMAALSLLIQVLLAYTLLPEGRGAYMVCIVFAALLGSILTPGAAYGTQYYIMTRDINASQGVASALIISLVGSVVALPLALPLIHSDIAFFQKAETHTFLLALVLVPLMAFSFALDQQFVAHRRFRQLGIFSLLRILTNVLSILIIVWHLELGVDGAVMALGVSHSVMIVACLLYLRRNYGLTLQMPQSLNFIRILVYGLKYHTARIITVLEAHIGIVVLGLISTQAEIGLFSLASALMLGFILISNAIGTALLPRIVGLDGFTLIAFCIRLAYTATAGCIIVFLALSAPLIDTFLPEAFLPIVPLLWIIAPGTLAGAISGILMTYFKGSDLPQICSAAVFLGLCVNLCSLPLLYPTLGIAAAAWAVTLGMLARCLLLAIVFHRETRAEWLPIWMPRTSDASMLWAECRSMLSRGNDRRSHA